MKKFSSNLSEPSQQQLNSLLKYYQTGEYINAEKLSLSITKEFPRHHFAWKILAAVLRQRGRIDESLIVCQKTVQLNPHDAEAHYTLGVIEQEKDKLKDAEKSYRKAIALNPNLAQAHYNLGVIMKKQDKLHEAEYSYRKAIAINPKLAQAHSNLGVIMKKLGRLEEACSAFFQVINLNPDIDIAYANLAHVIKNIKFTSSNIKIYPILIKLINNKNYVRPSKLVYSILSLLKNDPMIKNLLIEDNFTTDIKEANLIIDNLYNFKLLHSLMRICQLPDLQFERFFANMRGLILKNLNNFEATPKFIYFLSTLSIHCFINEHVYTEEGKETELVKNLESEIIETISKSKQPEVKKILCLASYRPLHQYDWCQKLEVLNNLEEVKSRLIQEPYAEKKIRAEIPILSDIKNIVSNKVRAQYEKNPYPRWIKIGKPIKPKLVSEIINEENLKLYSKGIKNLIAPEILIAGCGTGQHSLETAFRFSGCQVTAVDLSLASLAYAKRKTTELEVDNIEYFQADILNLNQFNKKFDIIESLGVLHHMDNPMIGWQTLTDLLKPGGLMKIGLYSELSRQHIKKIQREITLKKVGTSETELRKFRQSIIVSEDKNYELLTTSQDFFSLSTLRDLIFHVQEYQFTLPQIKDYLKQLGLKFCGLQSKDIISNFKKFHEKEKNIYDLDLWHNYERKNPRTFSKMYQFWCQKL